MAVALRAVAGTVPMDTNAEGAKLRPAVLRSLGDDNASRLQQARLFQYRKMGTNWDRFPRPST
jgi:hypothetical protein